jgi:hypothetical protein
MMSTGTARPALIVSGIDSGDTYLTWRWSRARRATSEHIGPARVGTPPGDDPRPGGEAPPPDDDPSPETGYLTGEPCVARIPGGKLATVMRRLDNARPSRLPDDPDEPLERAFLGDFSSPATEYQLFRELSREILPEPLRTQILEQVDRLDERLRIFIAPPPSLARLPWELLVLAKATVRGAGTRLLDIADIAFDVPMTAGLRRPVASAPPPADPDPRRAGEPGPVLYLFDPANPFGSVVGGLDADSTLGRRIDAQIRDGRAIDATGRVPTGFESLIWRDRTAGELREIRQGDLSTALRGNPAPRRMTYFGHVSSADPTEFRPERAALHLRDRTDAASVGEAADMGAPAASWVPLTAFDLVTGTVPASLGRSRSGSRTTTDPEPGHLAWPMPPRVALIGCDSGTDRLFAEPFGLVVAVIMNGAELVTATRWSLPTDLAFHVHLRGAAARATPTSDLVAAVDEAHDDADPVRAIADWKRARLARWQATTSHLADSPIVWASIATYVSARTSPAGPRTPD